MPDLPTPTQADVAEAMRLVPSPQLRRVFFDGLNNPNWVLPLLEAGQFGSPPEPVVDREGYIREKPWPEVDYLVRMAPLAPDAVLQVFASLKESENSWIRRSAIFVGANLPAEKAIQLKPVLEAWESTGFGFRTDPRDLATLAKNLLAGPKPHIGLRLARALFDPTTLDAQGRPRAWMEEYWYEEELPGVVEALGDRALQQVLRWLVGWERLAGNTAREREHAAFARPSIESTTRFHGDVEDTLINAVRDAAVAHMARDAGSAVAILLAGELSLHKRILLFAAARAIISLPQAESSAVIDGTIGLLTDPAYSDPSFRLELADYMRAVAEVKPDRLALFDEYLSRGPLGDRSELMRRLRREDDSDEEAETRADEFGLRWRHRLLAAIGAENLNEELKAQLAELEADQGVIEQPTRPDFQMTSWQGPESPLTLDELSSLSAADLAAHLESWHPEPDVWRGPSHGGQSRFLTTVLTTAPRALEGEANLATRLRPTYLGAILRGWEAALQGDADPDWDQLVNVVRDVLQHPDTSAFVSEGDDFDDDPDYSRARHAAVGLIREAVKVRDDERVPLDVIDRLGRVLLEIAEDDRFWDEYRALAPNDEPDPLTLSINAAWPIQAKAIIYLAGSATDEGLRAEALARLDAELAREDPFDALAAVIGESLPRLYLSNEAWLRTRVDQLFGTEGSISHSQQVALSTALATQHVHSVALGLLRGGVIAAMQLDEPIAVGWHHGLHAPPQLIGQWVITTHIRGQLALDDRLMADFFSTQTPHVRGDAIGHIAWEFMHAEQVDESMRVRLGELWDTRVAHVRDHPDDKAELKDFYWFIRSRKFPPEWWVPRLVEAAGLDSKLTTHGMIGEDLATAAPDFPAQVFEALVALTKPTGDASEPTMYDLMEHAVPPAIAWALATGDPILQSKANHFMNVLAERGYIDIQNRVDAVPVDRASGT